MNLPIAIEPPKFLFMELNKACNLRCQHCDFWKLEDDFDQFISGMAIESIIVELAQMNPGATVVTCGGEPMLNYPRYMNFCMAAHREKLQCFSVTNGTRIESYKRARDIIEFGPTEITISIDSPYPDKHDQWRGIKHSWKQAMEGLELLLEARKWCSKHDKFTKREKQPPKINVMTIVSERSYRDLHSYFELMLNDIGVDKAKLNIVQPTFGGGRNGDYFYRDNVVKNPDFLLAVLRSCDRQFNLSLNPAWLSQVHAYFTDIIHNQTSLKGWSTKVGTQDHICNTHDRNIMVDSAGIARLCFSTGFPGRPLLEKSATHIKTYRRGALRELWYKDAEAWRPDMRKCNRVCGISHSVRREHATLKTTTDTGH